VGEAERPTTFLHSHIGVPVNISPAFTLWPSSRHDFRFFGAFTTAFQQYLDDLRERLLAYNNAVETARSALQEALAAAMAQSVKDPAYQHWKATHRDMSTPPPADFREVLPDSQGSSASFGARDPTELSENEGYVLP
jgi:hypothetical protein